MKKLLCGMLATVLLLTMSGCTSSPAGSPSEASSAGSLGGSSSTSNLTPESSDVSKEPEESKESTKKGATIEELVLVDQDGIKVTAKSLELEGSFIGPQLKVLVENESEAAVIVQVRDVSINGITVESPFSCNVAAGKKANDEISFMSSELERAGITDLGEIELKLHIFDSETWDAVLDTEAITIKTSLAGTFEQVVDDSGQVLYEENGVKIVFKGLEEESFMGPKLDLYLENNGDKGVTVQVRDFSVNGFMVSCSMSCELPAGKKAFDGINLMSSDLEDNDITDIQDAEFSFTIFDTEDWSNSTDTPVVKVTVE